MCDDREKLIDMFSSTHLGDSLKELSLIYDDVERDTEEFCEEYSIHCTLGCGECCENFMPDITPAEANMIASYLIFIRKDMSLIEKVKKKTSIHCPLYDSNNPYHCQVYPVRPLVCRLFGQCASKMKDGKKIFRRCRFSGGCLMPERLEIDSSEIKTMDEYGLRLQALESGDVSDLDDGVCNALEEVGLISGFLGLDSKTPSAS